MLELVCKGLREAGHTPMPASDGDAGLDLAMSFDFDSIILDIGLPGRDGYSVAQAIRATKRVPILFLTARDGEENILRGFDLGADAYLTKPFSFRELLARLHAVGRGSLRRSDSPLVLDANRLIAYIRNVPVQLTRSEFLLLSALHQNRGIAVSRCSLMEAVWGEQTPSANTLDVLINALRAKLDATQTGGAHTAGMIVTVRGAGYRLHSGAANSQPADSGCGT
jgi:DNA-binding response OmpR family regulator